MQHVCDRDCSDISACRAVRVCVCVCVSDISSCILLLLRLRQNIICQHWIDRLQFIRFAARNALRPDECRMLLLLRLIDHRLIHFSLKSPSLARQFWQRNRANCVNIVNFHENGVFVRCQIRLLYFAPFAMMMSYSATSSVWYDVSIKLDCSRNVLGIKDICNHFTYVMPNWYSLFFIQTFLCNCMSECHHHRT